MQITLRPGEAIEQLRKIPDNSIDSIVTDPPYELGFMGKSWDSTGIAYSVELWTECLRVLKPGGHLLSFGGSRTYHRMACAIEDAGFQIRDQIMWIYGSGFPKSLDVSKAIDKAAGAEREVVGFDPIAAKRTTAINTNTFGDYKGQTGDVTAPATVEARRWQGWGTALKPAHEPVVVARKPVTGTVAANVLEYGTGAVNIDGCRIGSEGGGTSYHHRDENGKCLGHNNAGRSTSGETFHGPDTQGGRWPANVIHDGSDEVLDAFPDAPGQQAAIKYGDDQKTDGIYGAMKRGNEPTANKTYTEEGSTNFAMKPGARRLDKGSAARFFYCAKASKKDREDGNVHPTVKPTDLMRYLVRLVTPPDGTVLDPFMGSGSTGKAAILEGFSFVGIELEQAYVDISVNRLSALLTEDQYIEIAA
jgi:DNA modification methylase